MVSISILYEDSDVVVINKPSGLVVHPAKGMVNSNGKTEEVSVTDWVLNKYPDTQSVGEPLTLSTGEVIARPGIVHRLDRDTSGVLIIAKTQTAFTHLKSQFQDRRVLKEYRAFVYGEVKEEKGVIDRPIGRSAKDFRLRSAQRGARGALRDAVTDYKTLIRTKEYSLLALFPKTGRTHQIRVHLKAINHPVICDKLYAPKRECALGFERLALHSFALEIVLPSGHTERFEAPLPEDFVQGEQMLKG